MKSNGIFRQDDLAAIGERIVEMVDRLKDVATIMPGSQARQRITIDNDRFIIIVERDVKKTD